MVFHYNQWIFSSFWVNDMLNRLKHWNLTYIRIEFFNLQKNPVDDIIRSFLVSWQTCVVQWPGSTTKSVQRHFNASQCILCLKRTEIKIIIHLSSLVFISSGQHLPILFVLDFFVKKIDFYSTQKWNYCKTLPTSIFFTFYI